LNSGDCQTQISEDEEVEVYCDCLAEYFGDFCETKIYHEYNSVFYVAYQTGGVDQDANCAQVLSDLPETLASYTATLGTVSSMFHVAEVDSTDTNCTVQVTVSSTLDAPSPTVVANLETRFNVLSDTVVVDQPAHLAVGVSTAIGSQLGAEGSTSVAVAANSGSTRDAADDALVISMFITLGVMLVVVVGAIGLFKMNAFGLRDLTHNKYTMPA
jgi:hypothetical protein